MWWLCRCGVVVVVVGGGPCGSGGCWLMCSWCWWVVFVVVSLAVVAVVAVVDGVAVEEI